MNRRDEIVRAIGREIELHFEAHPNAADTAEGILRWWLPQEGVEVSLENVQRALDRLLASGHIAERRMSDGRRLYARARKPSADAG
ncbi:MAG: hypothetical protein MUP61_00780 [Burkholderiales bacterium]|nr:hypothetical protein [Burkholderiales bacterium]MCJ7837733.1 hypothetical protein [Burkholderiales bacterium]